MALPKGKVKIEWSPEFAYAIGLIVTDGSISKNGKHVIMTSKDREQIENFKACLGIENLIGKMSRASEKEKKYFRIQFGDVLFIRYLSAIGINSYKTFTIGKIQIPDYYFFDFFRGFHDGDGSFYSYWDKRWKSSFMYYLVFTSASRKHLEWLHVSLKQFLNVDGFLSTIPKKSTYMLRFAKRDSLKIIQKMYYSPSVVCLPRKHLKIRKALATIGEQF